MTRVYFDGSYRPVTGLARWAIIAYLPNGHTITASDFVEADKSSQVEMIAFRHAKRLAKHLAKTNPPVTIVGDDEGIIAQTSDTSSIKHEWVPRSENRAHFWTQLYPLKMEAPHMTRNPAWVG